MSLNFQTLLKLRTQWGKRDPKLIRAAWIPGGFRGATKDVVNKRDSSGLQERDGGGEGHLESVFVVVKMM